MPLEVDFSQVERALMALDKKARGSAIRNSLLKGANVVEIEIKKEIVRQGHKDTGSLYKSIGVTKMTNRGMSSTVRVGIDPNSFNHKSPRKVAIYGFILQFGTKKTAGTYWMTKAKNKSYDESRRVIAEEIKRVLGL